MKQRRWLHLVPILLVMYTISYVDRTNVSLALDPQISGMVRDLGMDSRMKGEAAGVFFFGYVLLQAAGGYWAARWSARRLILLCMVLWGGCAVACGLARTFREFEAARFLLGMAESCVFPAATVLMANWFPTGERVRANAYWLLCQPIAVVVSAPVTAWCLGAYGWRTTLVAEGSLPLLWAPVWWWRIRDHPANDKAISAEEGAEIESALAAERLALEPDGPTAGARGVWRRETFIMMAICILYVSAGYACMTFFTSTLKGQGFSSGQYGILFALPYFLTAAVMILTSRHSDRVRERRGHVSFVLGLSGVCLAASVFLRGHFWPSYLLLSFAIPGPFAVLSPFFAIPAETLPRRRLGPVVGLVNSFGSLGGFAGPYLTGWLENITHDVAIPFLFLSGGLIAASALALLLPRSAAVAD